MIRALFGCALTGAVFGLTGLACADYGGYRDPECAGVSCNSPPVATCTDSLTVRVYQRPGACRGGECTYGYYDISCAEGQCLDGACQDCTPSCGTRECGPDPGCGYSCGSCDPGCSCNASGQCECECVYPNHPADCSRVDYFQCGFEAFCQDGMIRVSWHEHVMCNGQEEIVPFTCLYACPHGCTEGAIIEWPENGQQLVADNCLAPDGCADILVDNQGPPGAYPFRYTEPDGAGYRFQQELAAFLAAHNVTSDDYQVEAHPITYTPDVDKRGAWITVHDTELSSSNLEAAASRFISGAAAFFKAEDAIIQARSAGCSAGICRVNFEQSYCGLRVVSPEPTYGGTLIFIARQQNSGLERTLSNLVPMIPIFRNPLFSQEEAGADLVGMQLEYWCADGPHYAQITALSEFAFSPDPVVFIRPDPAPTAIIPLEYRLAHQVVVTVGSFLSWTAYVDAFDRTLLKIDPDFICD